MTDYRDLESTGATAKALIDFMWGVWCPTFEDEVLDICSQDMQSTSSGTFLWHRHLTESTKDMGAKYRAFVDACTAGPIPTAPAGGSQPFVDTSEFGDADKEDLRKAQELLMALRRKTVSFVALPSVGGALAGDYTKAQMENMWGNMCLGHTYGRKKRTFTRSCSRRSCSPRTWPYTGWRRA